MVRGHVATAARIFVPPSAANRLHETCRVRGAHATSPPRLPAYMARAWRNIPRPHLPPNLPRWHRPPPFDLLLRPNWLTNSLKLVQLVLKQEAAAKILRALTRSREQLNRERGWVRYKSRERFRRIYLLPHLQVFSDTLSGKRFGLNIEQVLTPTRRGGHWVLQ